LNKEPSRWKVLVVDQPFTRQESLMDSVAKGSVEDRTSLKGAFSVDAEAVRVHVNEVVRGVIPLPVNWARTGVN